MKKQNNIKLASFKKKRFYQGIAVLCVALVVMSIAGVLAKYITKVTTEDEVKAALFVADGDYAKEIPVGGTVPRIEVSGWKDGIVLTLYNYKDGKVSAVDMTYTCTVPDGWTVSAGTTLPKNIESSETIQLAPPSSAKKGDEISFSLTTSPYAVTMQAIFVLTDSNVPDWTIEDEGEYTLLTVHTNDYEGAITVNYNEDIFAPDSTNALMADWTRNGKGAFTAERFTTYQLRFFEEISGTYTFSPDEGTGNSITITTTP